MGVSKNCGLLCVYHLQTAAWHAVLGMRGPSLSVSMCCILTLPRINGVILRICCVML